MSNAPDIIVCPKNLPFASFNNSGGLWYEDFKNKLSALNDDVKLLGLEVLPLKSKINKNECFYKRAYHAGARQCEFIKRKWYADDPLIIEGDSAVLFKWIGDHVEAKQESSVERSEGDRLMFFLTGSWPSDPKSLPPPPKVFGRTWDELADD